MLVLELVGWQSEFKNLTTNTTELMMAHTHTHTHTYTHTHNDHVTGTGSPATIDTHIHHSTYKCGTTDMLLIS